MGNVQALAAVALFLGNAIGPATAEDRLGVAVRKVADRWALWAEVYYRIAVAPKLVYQVDRLDVFKDGVWATFAVTNRGPKPTYMDLRWPKPPVARLRDRAGREWDVPPFNGCVQFANIDKFVELPAGGTVRFRSRMSIADKPLEPVGPGRVAPAARPTELDYVVAGWRTTYARPRDRIEEWVSMYAVGTGQATVKWHDAAAPDSWAFTAGPYPDGK
jgi:hypothetical protein